MLKHTKMLKSPIAEWGKPTLIEATKTCGQIDFFNQLQKDQDTLNIR